MRWGRTLIAPLAASFVCLSIAATSALADAIDGDWCFSTLNLNIQGSRIRTPGGKALDGSYSRHTFDYVVPADEPGAGTPIAMRLMSEDVMALSRGTSAPQPEIWRRCKPIS